MNPGDTQINTLHTRNAVSSNDQGIQLILAPKWTKKKNVTKSRGGWNLLWSILKWRDMHF
jgi:hypothetical protein